ncbi:MAG: hypothetical protein LRZ99_01090 [Desulfotomaculum sp.]|nr:hypothetical protein [Desulfotomaculum sp.]MCL0081496.1 hypothetical protein [Peptococcaceae bacterium]
MTNFKILIGSTVRQKPAILVEFLQSLNELDIIDLKEINSAGTSVTKIFTSGKKH